jgi:hypothetical protein
MIAIDSSQVKGESGTGFEKYDSKGPFECGNCRYFSKNTCSQKTMVARSKQPERDGGVEVHAKDCCEYVDRKGNGAGSLTQAARRK